MKSQTRVVMLTGPVVAGLSLILAAEVAARNDPSRPKEAMSVISAWFEEEIAGLDCRQIAAEAQSCFEKCWQRERSKVMKSCLTGSMRHCQWECRPDDKTARICRRELPAVFRKCCYLCGPSPVED